MDNARPLSIRIIIWSLDPEKDLSQPKEDDKKIIVQEYYI